MITFEDALKEGYEKKTGRWSFTFGDDNEYELCFEPLIWEGQHYVALYKNHELLTEKVVVKPGHTNLKWENGI